MEVNVSNLFTDLRQSEHCTWLLESIIWFENNLYYKNMCYPYFRVRKRRNTTLAVFIDFFFTLALRKFIYLNFFSKNNEKRE